MAAACVSELTVKMNTPNRNTIAVIPQLSPSSTMARVMTPVATIMNMVITLRPMRSDSAPNSGPVKMPGTAIKATWTDTRIVLNSKSSARYSGITHSSERSPIPRTADTVKMLHIPVP